MRILFIHEGLGQFQTLHEHLNAESLAHSWFLCSTSVYQANKDRIANLVPFQVPAENANTYFYTKNLEARIQRSFLIKKSISELLARTGIDVIVAHGSGGFPLQLFGEFDIPIITYIEFPSFTHHGYDAKYPQPDYASYRDKVFEMTSYHQVLKSELVIVPSVYAKGMFPACLHDKVIAQMEGFDITRRPATFARKDGVFHVGFAARDLSSAKGFEQFILIAKEILKKRQNVRFVFCGAPKVLYSYEDAFLQSRFEKENRPESFMKYVLEREGITLGEDSAFQHVDFASYDEFAGYVEAMDLFLYPLQFGSANWGLFELLFRAKVVIGSDRCFVPEVIRHRYNGLLCKYDDIQTWVQYATEVIDTPADFRHLGENALHDARERFDIRNVAASYLRIFDMAIGRRKLNG
ncbi:glycosyltransferase [Aromatoleum anaerobium]|uniref:Glycosyltransferase n=1 Tax=Aromatoleum anaerobium TaxID=182180 RepID=A0ABX1PIE4_9RHOO|nr:glycosyltransferase [Aromatoleum anaerobium]MCK0506739.1 glycosyltransferase [Aromatoleum anaerobium]